MPQIINPFRAPQSPLADVITKVGDQLFGDTLTPAIKREQLQKLAQERLAAERQNVETENLMRAFGGQDADLVTASQAAIGAGYDPRDLANMQLFRAANQYGAADQRAQNAQVGAGQSYDNTAGAFGAKLAETRRNNNMQSADRRYGVDRDYDLGLYKFNNELETALVDGQGQFVRRADAAGMQAPVSSNEMSPAAVFNQYYDLAKAQGLPEETAKRFALEQSARRSGGQKISVGADGGVSIESGGIGSLGETTNNVQSALQKGSIEAEQFLSLLDMAKPYVENSDFANDFGVVGKVRSVGQGLIEAGGALSSFANDLGYADGRSLVAGVQETIPPTVTDSRTGKSTPITAFFPDIYDPALDETDALWSLLVYKGAAALAGQEGRSVSDKDIVQFTRVFGNPKGLFESQASLRAKMDVAERIVKSQQRVRDNAMAGRPLSAGRQTTAQQPQQPGGSPQQPIEIRSEAEAANLVGQYVRLNGQVFKVEAD